MSKVFTDFKKSTGMKIAGIVSVIVIIVTIVIFGIIFTVNPNSENKEIENILDKEITSYEEITPEIQERLDEIEKIANESEYEVAEREWITSGPFQIDRSKYSIGENVFIRIGGLEYNEKGQIAFLRQSNATHYSVYMTIPFDGEEKSSVNTYFTPRISKTLNTCSIDDLIGKWVAVFRGTDYPNLEFEITETILPGTNIETVC